VAAAQTVPTHTWSHGTTINLFSGMATGGVECRRQRRWRGGLGSDQGLRHRGTRRMAGSPAG
jgi:hypothetical protein